MWWKTSLDNKLELLSIDLKNKILSESNIQLFITRFLSLADKQRMINKKDKFLIEKNVNNFLSENYASVFYEDKKYYIHKNSKLNDDLAQVFLKHKSTD